MRRGSRHKGLMQNKQSEVYSTKRAYLLERGAVCSVEPCICIIMYAMSCHNSQKHSTYPSSQASCSTLASQVSYFCIASRNCCSRFTNF